MSAVWVVVEAVRGSAPRDAGTAMQVTAEGIQGTIGGGALELRAIELAREMIANGTAEQSRTFPLGPGLGQCCGGAVTLGFTRTPQEVDAELPPPLPGEARAAAPELWVWGAGHVGRAVVHLMPVDAYRITWVDSALDRFPEDMPERITVVPARDMAQLAARAPRAARHLIFTYAHDIDLALCAALLRRGAEDIGLIGSTTKRARFFRRLRDMGLDPAPITCPIGDRSLGKAPMDIARGVVHALAAKGRAA
ncbi:xanthine dehydrogenase accessory protein XdhC [Pseudaestuariivita sp.]|uniref:xanthine dehydrogenase accessory protein XdhC n=1 Tax=Pseudaestuariivita sp. TaxID=2211669 RepID=UPI0040587E50